MSVRRRGRTVFLIAFGVLLLDGAAAIWLGQVSGRGVLIGVGLVLVAASLGLALLYRRWQAALDDVERAQRDVHREIDALRRAVSDVRGGRPPRP
jgi:UPF0716 family protein affecting phage T7 exclusion